MPPRDTLTELMMPPLAILGASAMVNLAVTAAVGAPRARRLACLNAGGLLFHVVAGLHSLGERRRAYAVLALSLIYTVWEVSIYVASIRQLRERSLAPTAAGTLGAQAKSWAGPYPQNEWQMIATR